MPVASIGYTLGRILFLFAGFFLVPVLFAAAYGESRAALAFVAGALLTAFAGGILIFTFRGVTGDPAKREMIVLPVIAWLVTSFFAGVPITLTGAVPNLGQGLFEGLSGLTTSGATVLVDVESVARAVLAWRALLQWLGGVATLAFAIAISPAINIGGAGLLNVALIHGESGSLEERLRGVTGTLLPVYLILTLLAMILYFLAGMPLFDAFCHALSTVSSGGFSTRNESIAAFGLPLVELVAVLFMLLAAVNFSYHWAFLRGKRTIYFKDPEVQLLGALFLIGGLVVFTGHLAQSGASESGADLAESLKVAFFTAASALSTTGFIGGSEHDLTLLGIFTVCALLFVGGGMGSTASGLKGLRLLLLLRHAVAELARLAHPSGAGRLHYLHKPVTDNTVQGIWVYYFLFLGSLALGTVGFAWAGEDLELAFYLALTAVSNTGAILPLLMPDFEGYAALETSAKGIYALGMLIGRIEVITALALVSGALWRR